MDGRRPASPRLRRFPGRDERSGSPSPATRAGRKSVRPFRVREPPHQASARHRAGGTDPPRARADAARYAGAGRVGPAFSRRRWRVLVGALPAQAVHESGQLDRAGDEFTPRGLRRTFNDLARTAKVEALVTKSISGHLTDRRREHYSTVQPIEQRESIGRVLRLVKGGSVTDGLAVSGTPSGTPSPSAVLREGEGTG